MKKGLIFATTLAMALGVGVAVGAHQKPAAEVKASTNYVKIAGTFTNPTWADGAIELTLSGGYYTYTRDFAANDEFKVIVNSDKDYWIAANWEGVTNSTDGGIVDGGGDDHNFKVATAGKYTVKAVSGIGDYGNKGYGLTVEPYTAPDVPEEDGYYVVGTKSNWKFAGATKMDAGQGTDKAQLIKYAGTAGEEFKVRSYLNGVEKWYGESNYEVGEVDKYLNIYVNENDGLWVEDWVEPDVPAEEGYYICGEFSGVPSWKYDGATKMTPTSQDGNVAYEMNFPLAVDDELRVRSYFTDRDKYDQWATVGNGTEAYGEKSGDNFKITAAGNYDIYAKYEQKAGDDSSKFYFYVSPHVESYEIEMTAVKFVGATKEGTQAQESQIAYDNQVFAPIQPAMSGYALRGYFTDADCTVAYEPHKFSADGHLYAKYTKAGFYVIHGPDWSIDEAAEMMTAGIGPNNKAEAAVTVETKNETYSFVYYNEEGKMSGQSGLGKEYAYAVYEESHIKFTETGTYAVYWTKDDAADNPNMIFLNDGSTAYCTTFLTATGGECKVDEHGVVTTDVEKLQTVWAAQKTAYQALNDGAKAEIVKVGFDGGKEDGTVAEQLMARYHYIVCKYGSERFENFIFPEAAPIAPSSAYIEFGSINSADNTTMIIIIAVAAVSALAFSALLIIKKKKQK